ncbi:MAG: leucyl aminopeptidase [Nitrospirota bacterium]|nr:leucyl aminopeptidase [Nitrospirota bacterium]
MKLTVKQGDIAKVKDDAIVVNLFEGTKKPGGATAAVDKALGGIISKIIKRDDFAGKLNQTLFLPHVEGVGAERVLLIGLGKQEELTVDRIRQVAAKSAKLLKDAGAKSISTVLHGAGEGNIAPDQAAQAIAEGITLGLYEFKRYKSEKDNGNKKKIDEVTIVEFDATRIDAIKKGIARGEIMAEANCLSRDLAITPSSDMTPTVLADEAKKAAKKAGLSCTILDLKDIKKLKMGGVLGVSRGSHEEPKFIILEHKGKKKGKPVVLVGKAITFDSGGISLKPGQGMEQMKYDMSGGAAVIGAMTAIARLKLPQHVIGLVPSCENMPSGTAYKPGDVLTAMNGKTMEIINTDAEGRLILADGLSYACTLKPAAIIDVATLTGACAVALGPEAIGLMGTDEGLIEKVRKASETTGERAWPLPLWDEYSELIKSDIADMKNTGGKDGGAITAGCFLKNFVEKGIPWAHLDIAGTAWNSKDKPYLPKGPSGIGARLLTEFVAGLAD